MTRNYNSKMGEKGHRPFKFFYLLDTNFKDTDPQVIIMFPNFMFMPVIYDHVSDLEA